MMKVLLIFALACSLASCELHWKLKKDTKSKNQRILFKEVASVYGFIDVNTTSGEQYLETPFSNGAFVANLAVSTFDNYIWIPEKGCSNTQESGTTTTTSSCGDVLYTCTAPNCKIDQNLTVSDFTSFYTNPNPVQVTTVQMALDTFAVKGQAVPGIQVALVKAMTNKNSFVQAGVLGLGYQNSFVQALNNSGVISKNEFSYYISDSENFLTFGLHDNYLAKFPTIHYKFDNGNLCSACLAQEATNKWSLLISDLVCTDTNTTVAGILTPKSRLVFDTTTFGYSLSANSYSAIKTFFAQHKGVSACTDNKSGYFGCKCESGLESLPTLKLTLVGNETAWQLTPEKYAEVAADGTCNIFFSTRVETSTDMDDHIFAGRLFTKFFFTSFFTSSNQTLNVIKISDAFQQPDPYTLSQMTMAVVLALGIIVILVIFITINAILKPAAVTGHIKQVVELHDQQQHTGYVYSGNKVEPTQTTQRNVQKQQ